jgi:hypothetical protein
VQDQSDILIQKLDEFIRRYYKNQLVRGALYSTGILLAAFLSVVLIEYFGEFNQLIRGLLFFTFLGASLFITGKYIALPLLKLNRIGHRISYDEAAAIIGSHFSNVQDKLLNVLQLRNHQALNGSEELLLAGINQKISELSPVPFATAIDLTENRKYLRYVLPLLLVTTLIAILWPQIISRSTTRLVNYSTYYEKVMPFTFNILNKELKGMQARDFKLELKISGNEIPDEVFITMNGIQYRLEKDNKINFHYTFTNLQSSIPFQLVAAGYTSREYKLEVLPIPTLLQYNVQLIYPSYLNKPNETIANTGDLQIPQGTKVNWTFNTRNTDIIRLRFADSSATPRMLGESQFTYSRRFFQNNHYSILPVNSFLPQGADSVSYGIQVIPDQYPFIEVSDKKDSLNPKNIYFSGQIKDDHGFSKLNFIFKAFAHDTLGNAVEKSGSSPVGFAKGGTAQPYFFFFDASTYNLEPGDKVEYYFEVFDNDGVNGPKSSKTQLMVFKAPTKDEINAMTSKNNSEIKKDLEESIKKARQLQKDVNELSKKINDKKQLGYEEKKKLEDILKKQQELESKINEAKQENEANNKQQNEFSPTEESILEKQKQLEQLFENIMTPEMKKLFDELNAMLEKLDKNQVQEKLDELNLNNKDIEKELDRNLEAFKQLEVQQKMQQAIDKLDELQKKEEELSKQTEGKKENEDPSDKKNEKENKNSENKKDDAASLEKKQEEIKKEFEELKKELSDIEQKNKELEEPNKLPDNKEKQDAISEEMQKSSEQLGKNNKKSAAKSQKSAAEKMQEMKEQMEQAMMEEEEKEEGENAKSLRQILENLLNLSFAQEQLIKDLAKTRIDNPKYAEIPRGQNKLREESRLIEDSLLALSKRAPQISALVNRSISSINQNMEKTVKALSDRNTGDGSMRMQSTMKSVNDLAVLLNESLEQMQQQMKQQMQSKSGKAGKCKKPGSGTGEKPGSKSMPASSMRKMQEQLNKQLQELKDALEKGQKPGEKPGQKKGEKPGSLPGPNGKSGQMQGSSEQFAKMAAQQEALRRQMEQLMDKLKNKGRNPGGDIANLMEQTEKELVNKQISSETMRRQQDILSRLLESEKAEREREQDEQRKSSEAKNENLSNPQQFLEYKRQKEKEMELLNTVPPSLTPYYREKVNNYFNSLNK